MRFEMVAHALEIGGDGEVHVSRLQVVVDLILIEVERRGIGIAARIAAQESVDGRQTVQDPVGGFFEGFVYRFEGVLGSVSRGQS
jgi:hypothetical protein